jgi:hypothetical protein
MTSYPPPSVVMSHHTERNLLFDVTMVYVPDGAAGLRVKISKQLDGSHVMRKCNAPSTSRNVSSAFNRENLCVAALTLPDAFKADAMPSKYSHELLAPDTRWENTSVTEKKMQGRE